MKSGFCKIDQSGQFKSVRLEGENSAVKILDQYNRDILSGLQRGGRSRIKFAVVEVVTGTSLIAVSAVERINGLYTVAGALLGSSVAMVTYGLLKLRNARRLDKEIQEKSPKEVFVGMPKYF